MLKKPKYYWDTCIFLALLKDEPMSKEDKQGLIDVVKEIDSCRAILITSVQTLTEIQEANLTNDQIHHLELSLKKPSTAKINIDLRVAELAGQIRSHYNQQGLKVTTTDAIHLATAFLHKADELHTFDLKMLRFNGNLMGLNLKICKPTTKQLGLPF
jgi:predicted nucleic acid-binding protein